MNYLDNEKRDYMYHHGLLSKQFLGKKVNCIMVVYM